MYPHIATTSSLDSIKITIEVHKTTNIPIKNPWDAAGSGSCCPATYLWSPSTSPQEPQQDTQEEGRELATIAGLDIKTGARKIP